MLDKLRTRFAKWLMGGGYNAKVFGAADFVGGVELTKLSSYESYLKEGSRKVWALWLGAHLCADAVASAGVQVVRKTARKPVTGGPLSNLLVNPNPEQNTYELLYLTVMHLKFTGNSFWYRIPEQGKPAQLWTLNPKRVSIIPNQDGSVARYELSYANSQRRSIPADAVTHIRRPHPNNDWWGIGEVEAGEAMIQDTVNRADWSENFWRNGAAPAGILVNKPGEGGVMPRDEEFQKVKRSFRSEYSGRENSGKIAFLGGNWEHIQLGLTMQDMQSIEQSRWSVEQVFSLLGVPLSVAGIKDAANYATAQMDEIRFRKYTILPLCRLISEALTSDIASLYGPDLAIEFATAQMEFLEGVMAGLSPMLDRGIITVNEARKICGLQPDPNRMEWEQAYILDRYIPIEHAGAAITEIAGAIAGQQLAAGTRGLNGHATEAVLRGRL